jgi:L-2-hydroxyglutarate oxidase LhgO
VRKSPFDFDAAVVGAGAVGLATAFQLGRAGLSVVVLEKGAAIGQGVSSRNSEVIHAGLYFPADWLKSRLCVRGRPMLYAFLEAHRVGFQRCGKLVVATEEVEVAGLRRLFERARANGVEGLEWLSGQQARGLEPEVRAEAAILSPETGVVDSHGYMLALAGAIEAAGGVIALRAAFESACPRYGGFAIRAGGAEITAGRLVIAAGLGAQAAAASVEGYPADRIPALSYGKGVYFRLAGKSPFRRLVYPMPGPGSLGAHSRIDLGGQTWFGPDLAYVEAEDYAVDPARADGFYAEVRRYWPGLPDGALEPGYAGVRPKLHGPGEPQPDFRIDGRQVHGIEGLVAMFGIESPGLTSSLAIGEMAAKIDGGVTPSR